MKFKKLLAGALACVVLGGAVSPIVPQGALNSVTASAEEDYTSGSEGGLSYKKYSDHIEIDECNYKVSGELNIPDTIEDLPVTVICRKAFQSCSYLESITIPDSVTSIGSYAFSKCYSLKSITISDSVTSISSGAFDSCYQLESVTLPNSITKIEDLTFAYCNKLKTVTIPDSVTEIGACAFGSCRSLETMIIPDSVTSIEWGAFNDCPALTSLTLSENLTSVPQWLCQGCSSLKSIVIPESVTSIGAMPFDMCTVLESVTIKNPECEIYDHTSTFSDRNETIYDSKYYYFSGTIYGYPGSTAESYANKYNRKFVSIGEAPAGEELEVTVSGDATCDEKVDIGDAVLIMQSVVNPDKYGVGGSSDDAMTKQGKVNADCYEPGSGVTPMDALAVQKLLLGSIESLPENWELLTILQIYPAAPRYCPRDDM